MEKVIELIATKSFLFVFIIMIISIGEILCLEFSCGFLILSSEFENIIEQISFATFTSSIFYFFVSGIPYIRNKQIYDDIAYKEIIFLLQISKIELDDFFRDQRTSLLEHTNTIKYEDKNEILKEINKIGIEETRKRYNFTTKNIKEQISKCLVYKEYLDAKTFQLVNKIHKHIGFIVEIIGDENNSYATELLLLFAEINELYITEKKRLSKLFPDRIKMFKLWDK